MNMSENHQPTEEKRNDVREFFSMGELFGYFFRKKDPNRQTNFNLRMMHGINKISIIVFLLGIIFLIIKHIF